MRSTLHAFAALNSGIMPFSSASMKSYTGENAEGTGPDSINSWRGSTLAAGPFDV